MSTYPIVAFDEAGNTGQDLLSEEQPVFVLSSVYMDQTIAEGLIQNVLTPQLSEAHFVKLSKSKLGIRKLEEFYNSVHLDYNNILVKVINKRFMVITKMVDILIETMTYDEGYNLYYKGQALSMSNLYYYCIPSFFGKEANDELSARFVNMIRNFNNKTVYDFYKYIKHMKSIDNKNFSKELKILLDTEEHVYRGVSKNDNTLLDPAIPAFYLQAPIWGNKIKNDFNVIHDKSKAVEQYEEITRLLSSDFGEARKIKYGNKTLEYPLKINKIEFVDSKEFSQIQIADLIASGVNTWVKGTMGIRPKDDLWHMLDCSNLTKIEFLSLWPSGKNFVDDILSQHLDPFETHDPAGAIAEFLTKQQKHSIGNSVRE